LIEHAGSALLPAIMLPLFAATALSTFINRMPAPHAADTDQPRFGLWALLRRPGVLIFVAVVMLMQISFGPFYVFYTLHLSAAGWGTDSIGVFWALGVLAEIGLFLIVPQLLRRHAVRTLVLLCLGLTVLRWLATAFFADSLVIMLIAQLTHALSFGVFHACSMQMIVAYFPRRSSAQGQALVYALGSGIGGVIGSVLAGMAWDHGGGQAAFLFGAAAALAGFVVASRLRVPELPATQPSVPLAATPEI
jgi:PPP family 3-phenylpropionic acid transporter